RASSVLFPSHRRRALVVRRPGPPPGSTLPRLRHSVASGGGRSRRVRVGGRDGGGLRATGGAGLSQRTDPALRVLLRRAAGAARGKPARAAGPDRVPGGRGRV